MDPNQLNQQIKNYGKSLGFDDVGVASVDGELPYAQEFMQAYKEGRFGPLDYLKRTAQARVDLRSIFKEARSVVVVIKNYYTGNHPDADGKPKIARYAWGRDYHQWFRKRLFRFRTFLEQLCGQDLKFWPFNDTGPFLERSWAVKAGLGFLGKSALFIHRGYGTWTFIGGFATNLEIGFDAPYLGPDCGTCSRCIDACPTKAINKPHQVDANRCIATWTIERPLHESSVELAPRDHQWAFGCDICQEVCPWNKFQKITKEERFMPLPGRVYLTKETFMQDLRGSPLFRSSKAGLLVNFLRIKNSLNSKSVKMI